jgi:hypothetical protein
MVTRMLVILVATAEFTVVTVEWYTSTVHKLRSATA